MSPHQENWLQRAGRSAQNQGNKLLARGRTDGAVELPLEDDSVNSIIVFRVIHRVGNDVLLTPLLRELRRRFPSAVIDLVVGDEPIVPLMAPMPSMGRVIAVPRRPWRHPLRFTSALRAIRNRHYDLAVDPSRGSTSNRLAMSLAHATWRMGFESDDHWIHLTHTVPKTDEWLHAAVTPLLLLGDGRVPDGATPRLDLCLSTDEIAAGGTLLRRILAAQNVDLGSRQLICFFVEGRRDKKLPDAWWQRWCATILEGDSFCLVQLLPPSGGSPVTGVPELRIANLREVAAVIANFDLFVSVDTGPMHLGSASLTPTVGLFTVTRPEIYGPLGPDDLSIKIDEPEPAARQVLEHLANLSSDVQDGDE